MSVVRVLMRESTISTRRFFARPSAVELLSMGSWLAYMPPETRRGSHAVGGEVPDHCAGASAGKLPVAGYCEPEIGCESV